MTDDALDARQVGDVLLLTTNESGEWIQADSRDTLAVEE